MSVAVYRDLTLLHSLQKGGLGSGSGAVYLVCQNDVGEEGAFPEFKVSRLLIVKVYAGKVGREQVGSELYSFKISAYAFGKSSQHHCLACAGNILQKHMGTADKGYQNKLCYVLLADNGL